MKQQYRPNTPCVLILTSDPLGGALIGAAVELAGVTPAFVRVEESPKQALRRLRPSCVLLDCDDPATLDEGLLGPAMMAGIALCLYGAERRVRDLQHLATRYQLTVIALPQDIGRFTEILRRATESSPRRRRSTAQ